SIPAIGANSAVRIIAEIGNIQRFDNNRQLNAYTGIDIRRYQSVQNMIRQRRFGGNHIVEYYDKLKTQPYNKCHKVASVACVNK
ncbi:transposase, partial [Lysinibacillus sp. CTST325]